MKIAFICENFLKNWQAEDIDNFLPGCQECVVLFSEELAKNDSYKIEVLSYGPVPTKNQIRNKVHYKDFSKFSNIVSESYNVIILFNVSPPLLNIDEKTNVIYWSSDVQLSVKNSHYIKKYVCLTEYHKRKNNWDFAHVIPHGIDIKSLDENKTEKSEDICIYTSSPDRGLMTLLENWSVIKQRFPNLKLYITYGFSVKSMFFNVDESAFSSKIKLICNLLNDVYYLGSIQKNDLEKLYWQAKYWFLPLNKETSELFCLSAIKAQYCKVIPVIYPIGALSENVKEYIHFDNFIQGDTSLTITENNIPIYDWSQIVNFWKNLIE